LGKTKQNKKPFTKIGLMEWLKVKALSSSPRIEKKKKFSDRNQLSQTTVKEKLTSPRTHFQSLLGPAHSLLERRLALDGKATAPWPACHLEPDSKLSPRPPHDTPFISKSQGKVRGSL
jgi:hypothetical protein